MARLRVVSCVLVLVLIAPSPAYQEPLPQLTLPTYPEKAGGLKKLVQDILKAYKATDQQAVLTYLNSLFIPDAEAWFEKVFGEQQGAQLAASYARMRGSAVSGLGQTFEAAVQDRMTDVDVRRFDKACDPDASEEQYPILAARQQPEPFYVVQLMHGNYGKVVWFFAYVDGGFRYVGAIRLPEFPSAASAGVRGGIAKRDSGDGPARIIVGTNVQRARLIHQVPPEYPYDASRVGLRRTVRMTAVISREGTVQNIKVLQGHCWLAEAAVKAVRKWRYQPTLANGQPVEVLTTIEVTFSSAVR